MSSLFFTFALFFFAQSLLNFKMDGGTSLQVFEGVDYSHKELARQRRMELLQDVRHVCFRCALCACAVSHALFLRRLPTH